MAGAIRDKHEFVLLSQEILSNPASWGFWNAGSSILKVVADNVLITGKVLHQKWKTFADLCNVPDDECLTLSKGWLTKLKLRNSLKEFKWHGKVAWASTETVGKEWEHLHELIIKSRYEHHDIFNGDESSLFYVQVFFFFWNINHF